MIFLLCVKHCLCSENNKRSFLFSHTDGFRAVMRKLIWRVIVPTCMAVQGYCTSCCFCLMNLVAGTASQNLNDAPAEKKTPCPDKYSVYELKNLVLSTVYAFQGHLIHTCHHLVQLLQHNPKLTKFICILFLLL